MSNCCSHGNLPHFGLQSSHLNICYSHQDLHPSTSNHSLYLTKLLSDSSYPEGNFGVNQLLDGSISLSPLYPSLTNDLHVSTATSLHQSF
eukprot:gene519-gene40